MRQRDERVASLEAELERRLKELEQREAALKKIADAVMKRKPAAPQPDEDHQARLQELEARESALKRIADVVERRRTEIEETVRAAEERAAGLQERLAAASSAAGRVAELEAEVAQLRAELDDAHAAPPPAAAAAPVPSAESRSRGLFGRRRRAEQPPPVVEPPVLLPPTQLPHEPEPEPEPQPEAAPAPEPLAVEGRPTLSQLEHLADEASLRRLPQADEWLAYVRVLREHAWLDGTIPPQFDDILREVFGATL